MARNAHGETGVLPGVGKKSSERLSGLAHKGSGMQTDCNSAGPPQALLQAERVSRRGSPPPNTLNPGEECGVRRCDCWLATIFSSVSLIQLDSVLMPQANSRWEWRHR